MKENDGMGNEGTKEGKGREGTRRGGWQGRRRECQPQNALLTDGVY